MFRLKDVEGQMIEIAHREQIIEEQKAAMKQKAAENMK